MLDFHNLLVLNHKHDKQPIMATFWSLYTWPVFNRNQSSLE